MTKVLRIASRNGLNAAQLSQLSGRRLADKLRRSEVADTKGNSPYRNEAVDAREMTLRVIHVNSGSGSGPASPPESEQTTASQSACSPRESRRKNAAEVS
jgi:hypothetical protein